MMLVNNPGDSSHTWPPLLHSKWDGWTFTDTVFPFFLWIAGVAMTLSFARRVERGEDRRQLLIHALKRSGIIFLIGLLLYSFPKINFATIRIPGVLQRIAICYAIAAAIFLFTSVRGQIIWLIGLLAAYWCLMMYVPVPGFGAGVLTPEGNFAGYVDRLLLPNHLYAYTKTWDPEGVISTLPSIATLLLGILAGQILRQDVPQQRKVLRLLAGGVALILGGQILDHWMPINKNLWSVSFCLFMAGLATVLFSLWYWILDVKGWLRTLTRPLAIYGMNAIALYIAAGAIERFLGEMKVTGAGGAPITLGRYIFNNWFVPTGNPYQASFHFALAFVLLMYCLAYLMYRKGWFLRF
jgi:predicted acyltransferase